MPKTKDFPLLLRRKQDGSLQITSETWPPRHEFSTDWLLTSGVAQINDQDEIVVELANGRAVYTIDRAAMEEEYVDEESGETKTRQLSTGYWGKLKEGHVDG
jgi:hypothetical protein